MGWHCLLVYYVPPCIQTPWTPESSLCELRTASSTFHALHCRRAVFEPSCMLVHLCWTLCPFISRTAIWLLQLSCAILSLISFLSTDFVLSTFRVWSHKRAIKFTITYFRGVAHWASLWGRPQRWHVKGACATRIRKKEKDRIVWWKFFSAENLAANSAIGSGLWSSCPIMSPLSMCMLQLLGLSNLLTPSHCYCIVLHTSCSCCV